MYHDRVARVLFDDGMSTKPACFMTTIQAN